jgi:chromate transport protein ChrA
MEPSSVAWNWRQVALSEAELRAREARAARRRGALGGTIGLAAAALVYFALGRPVAAAVVAGVAVLIALLAFAAPLTLYKSLSRALDRFAHAVGAAVTWVLMTVLFYLLFLPVGLFLRMRGKLAITHGADRRLATYWRTTDGSARTPESYKKQF